MNPRLLARVFAAFVQLHAAGDPRADYVDDGALSVHDLSAFAIDLAGRP